MSTLREYVQQAVEMAGSQRALADGLGISQQGVSYLLNGAVRCSAEMALRMERATKGKITRHDLRADIFGPAPRKAAS